MSNAVKPIDQKEMADINDVADFLIVKMNEAGWLNVLKLQKLLYYVQAWMLAIHNRRCFSGEFQAWVHGPVNREIYNRFKDTKSMYSRVRTTDVRPDFKLETLPPWAVAHINEVLEVYGDLSDDQLEEMTHQEKPWIEARGDCSPRERCESEIDQHTMRDYYAARIAG